MAQALKMKNKKYQPPIVLENERSELITKEKNNLGGWGFFKYLYSKYVLRLLGLNLLMLFFLVPAFIFSNYVDGMISQAAQMLPNSNSFGLGIAPWGGIESYLVTLTNSWQNLKYLTMLGFIPFAALGVCGGFAVIRDAYWTGQLKIFKPFFKGIYQTYLQVLPFAVIIAGGFLGIHFFAIGTASWAPWISILVQVLLYIVLGLFGMWALVFTGVATIYKQGFVTNLKSSLQLTARYFVSNFFSFAAAILPFVLFIVVNVNFIYLLLLTVIFMFGMIYVGLIWMIHMIRICSNHAGQS